MATPIKYDYTPKDQTYMRRAGIRNINYYAEKIQLANAFGYDSYIEFVIETYRHEQSTRAAGRICGMEQTAMISFLKRLGVDLGGRGGSNNPWGKRGKS